MVTSTFSDALNKKKKQDQTQDVEVKAFAENTKRLLKEIDSKERKIRPP